MTILITGGGGFIGSRIAKKLRERDSKTTIRLLDIGFPPGLDGEFPCIADVTADFVYARQMGTVEKEKLGYSKAAIAEWAARAKAWKAGGLPQDLPRLAPPAVKKQRDVFLFVISGAKAKNPAAAMALIHAISD